MENLIKSMNAEIASANRSNISEEQVEQIAKARIAMQNGVVKLTFIKNNGDLRVVERATTKSEHVAGTCGNGSRHTCVTPFYDLSKNEWRSFAWAGFKSYEVVE